MMTKEFLQWLLQIVPNGYTIEFEIKGRGPTLAIVWIRIHHDTSHVEIHLADEYNQS